MTISASEKKVLLTATVQSHICQFHKPLVEVLHEHVYEVHVAAHDNLAEKNGLMLDFADAVYDVPFARSPVAPGNLRAYSELRKILAERHFDLIVCNTPVGGILTRLAARSSRKRGTKVVYIAHGFHFYKGASWKNWLLFFPLEKAMARLCDLVITINEEDYRLAKEHFPCEVARIHGVGVRADRYHPVAAEERAEMRYREGLGEEDFVVVCTGELNENKNQKTLISAASLLREKIPELKVLLAGNGPNELALREQIAAEHLEDTVRLLGYRTDLERVVPAADAVASCSKREGLPLNIVEAMLCRKPIAASINRGHTELIQDGKNGYLLEPEDVNGFADRILRLRRDPALAKEMGDAGYAMAQAYTVRAVKQELCHILTEIRAISTEGTERE